MDGLTLAASVVELRALIGGRIEKIQQPDRYELLFSLHTNSGNKRFIVSASSENCRLHLTEEKRTSPIDAPNFLMLLRKHLSGARISAIEQPELDRVVTIRFDTFTELHDATSFTLVCEIMGKYSNIILVDSAGNIVDSIRRVSSSMSSVRLVLPHLPYSLPPKQEKLDPSLLAPADFDAFFGAERPDKAVSSGVYGLSPAIASLLLEAHGSDGAESCGQKLARFYSELLAGRFSPCIAAIGEKRFLLPFVPSGCTDAGTFSSIGEAADEFYRTRAEIESVKRRTSSLEHIIALNIQRLERKIDKFSVSICDEDEIERFKLYGELITANLYAISERSREAVVLNYYLDPPENVKIELDETLSPADNAQQYYKKYRKAKSAREFALVKRAEALEELDYLNSVQTTLSQCLTDSDFDEVRTELADAGYVRSVSTKKRTKLPKARPHHFVSSDGFDIYVGKNNSQNDRLTFKESSPQDIWLHTKDIHGSHVILKSADGSFSDAALAEAAELAAYYSQARASSAVPVDYTKRRFVKKPSGARPGMVIYTDQRTLYVTPSDTLLDRLTKKD